MKEALDKSEKPVKEDITEIVHNYRNLELEIINRLYFYCKHPTSIGTFREDVWETLFKQIVPKKFAVEHSVFIIDSNGSKSKEVDLVIFDEQYTPYIFNYGQLKFIPIEAVAIVVECKSNDPGKEGLVNWVESIDVLETSLNSVVRQFSNISIGKTKVSTQTGTRPIKILCCLNISRAKKNELLNGHFDIVMEAKENTGEEKNKNEIEITYTDKLENLNDWYETLNHNKIENREDIPKNDELKKIKLNEHYTVKWGVKHSNEEVTLLSFTFQLNQLLMLINNPIFFPHRSYVEMFNKILGGEEDA